MAPAIRSQVTTKAGQTDVMAGVSDQTATLAQFCG
jgi:hypothetical protein